jgi:thioredoxin-dependent peroxiredoxin
MVDDGNKAPDFEVPKSGGGSVKLSKLKGKAVVLYFYPKDDTSGCTVEAKDFTALAADFQAAGVHVLGMSPDSAASHDKSIELGADEDHAVSTAYGVWVEKSMYGKKYMGVERSTFLIDKTGKVAKSWRKVKVPGHAAEVLAAAKALAKA